MLGAATLAAFPFEQQPPDVRTQKWFRGVFAGWSALAEEYPYYKLKASTILAQNGISKEDFTDTDGASQRSHAQASAQREVQPTVVTCVHCVGVVAQIGTCGRRRSSFWRWRTLQ